MASKQAQYHQHGKEPITLDVIETYPDGKVDLGHGKELIVGKCVVSETSAPGTCTLIKAPSKSKAGKQPSADEKAKAIAECEAALKTAKEAFAADSANVDLGRRVDELQAALDELLES